MKTLYRYREVTDHSLSGIENNEFYFAAPAEFNDPFDCKNLFSFQGASNDDWRIFLNNCLIYTQPDLTEKQRKNAIEQVIASGEHRTREKLAEQHEIWDDILEKESNKLGIVCLSEKPDDILLWSHYANRHEGFTLQFDRDKINGEPSFYCDRVRYKKNYPTFSDFVRSDLNEIAKMFLFTKSKHWEYEREVRLVVNAENEEGKQLGRLLKYPSTALTSICFGCRTSDIDKQKISDALSKSGANASFYRCEKSKSSYSVKIVAA